MNNLSFPQVLQSLVTSAPMLLVTIVGLLLVLMNWQKLGRAALPAAGGLGLHLLTTLANFAAYFMLMGLVTNSSAASTTLRFQILGITSSILHAAALALLVVALLVPRTPAVSGNNG